MTKNFMKEHVKLAAASDARFEETDQLVKDVTEKTQMVDQKVELARDQVQDQHDILRASHLAKEKLAYQPKASI